MVTATRADVVTPDKDLLLQDMADLSGCHWPSRPNIGLLTGPNVQYAWQAASAEWSEPEIDNHVPAATRIGIGAETESPTRAYN